jgi:nucleotide-binding universal stress UspA family protein
VARAGEAARVSGYAVTVISVAPVTTSPRGGSVDPTSDVAEHRRMLEEAREQLAADGVDAEVVVATGHPAATIVQAAEDGGYDLVVVGSRGLSGVRRMLMGSVSSYVVTHAHGDVLVVRPPRD